MKVLLECTGEFSVDIDQTRDYTEDNVTDKLQQFRLRSVVNGGQVSQVIDSSNEDKAIILDMVKRHSLEVEFGFLRVLNLNTKLTLTLKSALFSELEAKFKKNFTITGEIELMDKVQPLPPPSGPYKLFIKIAKQEGLKAKDGDVYSFQDVKYGNHFYYYFLARINDLPLQLAKIKLWIETLDAKTTRIADSGQFKIVQKILNDGIATDVTIIASNDAQIKCHKSFLIAQSAMFEGMLNSGMQEATSGVIEMKTFSEPGVRALLAYLYYWDLTLKLRRQF